MTLPQTHSALARTDEAVAFVRAALRRRRLGPPLGAEAVGLDVPDVVAAGAPFDIAVPTMDDPAAVTCRLVDAETGVQVDRPEFTRPIATARLPRPGIYRVEVKGGASSAVTQLILVDALDEAQNPLAIASFILRRLAALPCGRVVVGTRASTKEGPDWRRLRAAELPISDTAIDDIAGLVRGQNRQFLYARLAVPGRCWRHWRSRAGAVCPAPTASGPSWPPRSAMVNRSARRTSTNYCAWPPRT